MLVKINGKPVAEFENGVNVTPVQIKEVLPNPLEQKVNHLFKYHIMPASMAMGVIMVATPVFAAETGTIGDKLMPIIHVLQDLALPVGIGMSTWGLIELMVGNFQSGKQKLKYALIGYIGMFLIPEAFYTIKSAFQGG